MSFLDIGNPDYQGVAWDETANPPVAVIVGAFGIILYSVGREYAEGFQVYTLEQSAPQTYNRLYSVGFGGGTFLVTAAGGMILTSENGQGWDLRETGVTATLYDAAHITSEIWVAVGVGGGIVRTTDNGVTWTEISSPTAVALFGIAYGNGLLIAVGFDTVIVSDDDGLTWSSNSAGVNTELYGVSYGDGSFFIVGKQSTVLKTVDGQTFEVRSSPTVATFRAVVWTGGLWVAVGSDGATITSTDGEVWDAQNSGIPEASFLGIGYGDNRLVVVGEDSIVGYSATGAGRAAFDLFQPISDIYRAQCFTQQDAYMVYGGIMAFEEGVWNYYPRRITNPAPGTVDDFDTVGWYAVDLPGTGAILDMVSVRGGIVLAETDQLGLLTDGGSLTLPWAYTQNYGEGLKPISNLTSFNGVAFLVADDGLIYTATSTGVSRLSGFFDLTRFEDWEPGDESVWLGFDPVYQLLFVFRQKSPWTVWLVNDQTGGVSEIELPEITIDGVDYEPRSAFIITGLHDGIHASYAPTTGSSDEIVTVKLDLDGPLTGIDEVSGGDVSRHYGDCQTGSFRVIGIGIRGECDELLVRTWANPDSTVRPDLAVMVREETDEGWLVNDQPEGDITVFTDRVRGVGTAWSRYIDIATKGGEIDVTIPQLELEAVNVSISHPKPIDVTVPELHFEVDDVIVYRGTDIPVTIPEIELEAVDVSVTHNPPINVTVPELTLEAVDAQIHRAGYYVLPWLVSQCKVYKVDLAGTRTLVPFTKTGTHELILTTPLTGFERLYVNPGAVRPVVLGRAGDYIFTSYGAHRISAVNTAYEVELDWYPPEEVTGTYIPAQEIPAGGKEGDGKVIVGLGRGFDQLMLRVLLLPHGAVDATGAKITGLELGYMPTGPELKTDAGG